MNSDKPIEVTHSCGHKTYYHGRSLSDKTFAEWVERAKTKTCGNLKCRKEFTPAHCSQCSIYCSKGCPFIIGSEGCKIRLEMWKVKGVSND